MDEILELAFHLNPVMMLIFSPRSGQIIVMNQSCAEKFGLPNAEFIGSRFQEMIEWDEPYGFRNLMERLQRERKVSGYEACCRSSRGKTWHALISAAITTQGPESCVIASIEDITTFRRMEEALHRSKEFYRLLADCAGDVIWVLDLDGRCTYMSHAIEYRLGYKPEEVIGQPFDPLLTPASAAIAHELLQNIAARVHAGRHIQCQRIDLELVRKTGTSFWAEINFCGMYQSTGEFIGLQGISRDITDRKRAEDALRETDRRKNEFMAMLAHELRNPLAPINNAVQVMKLSPANESIQTHQQALIERQIRHLSRLVDDLLDLARINQGKINLCKEIIALRDVVLSAIETSMIQSGKRKDDFSWTMPKQNILVKADSARLVQAICNLLENAMKFSDAGEQIRLDVSLEPAAIPGLPPQAVIRVDDQGQGIEAGFLPAIYDLFAQADRSLDRTRGGLGIGLTLTRRIIDLHGGSIQASSAGLGQGSRFCLRLPVIADQEQAASPSGQNPLGNIIINFKKGTREEKDFRLRNRSKEIRETGT